MKKSLDENPGTENNSGKNDESLLSSILSLVILVVLVFGFKYSILDANNIPSGSMIPTLKIGDYLFVNKMRYSIRFPFTDWVLWNIDDPDRGDIITFLPPGETDKHYVKRVMAMPGDRIRIREVPTCRLPKLIGKQFDPKFPRDFVCDRRLNQDGYPQPQIAFVEYKPGNTGPWLNYAPEELSAAESMEILNDADNARVLHPKLVLPATNGTRLPVLFREHINGKTHLLVETPESVFAHELCPTIDTGGCLLGPTQYLAMGDNRDDSKDSRFLGLIERERILGKALIIYFSINWKDDLCRDFFHLHQGELQKDVGYKLPEFPPDQQYRYCSRLDTMADYESILTYIQRTFFYRIPRMSVRWSRIANLLR